MQRRLIAIVGATATGKTGVAESVADAIDAEVVCVDSRQVYRDLEVGTGKPGPDVRLRRPHHLFDALALDEVASAGWYAAQAASIVSGIHARGRPAVLVGGTGLYVRAIHSGLNAQPPRNAQARAALESRLEALGVEALHAELSERDPATARRVSVRDAQRVVRALEVLDSSGIPLSHWHVGTPHPVVDAQWRLYELVASAADTAAAIHVRTCDMLARGLIAETADLVRRGSGKSLRALKAIGYDECLDHLEKGGDLGAVVEAIDRRTRQLAKRQRTWFRHQIEAERVDAGAGRDPAGVILRGLTWDRRGT